MNRKGFLNKLLGPIKIPLNRSGVGKFIVNYYISPERFKQILEK